MSAIWSEIKRMITKLHDREAGVRFCNHAFDFRPKLHNTKFNYNFIISIMVVSQEIMVVTKECDLAINRTIFMEQIKLQETPLISK